MYEIKLANVLWDRPFNLQGGGGRASFYSEPWEEEKNLACREKRKYSDLQFSQYNMHQKRKEYDFCRVRIKKHHPPSI